MCVHVRDMWVRGQMDAWVYVCGARCSVLAALPLSSCRVLGGEGRWTTRRKSKPPTQAMQDDDNSKEEEEEEEGDVGLSLCVGERWRWHKRGGGGERRRRRSLLCVAHVVWRVNFKEKPMHAHTAKHACMHA